MDDERREGGAERPLNPEESVVKAFRSRVGSEYRELVKTLPDDFGVSQKLIEMADEVSDEGMNNVFFKKNGVERFLNSDFGFLNKELEQSKSKVETRPLGAGDVLHTVVLKKNGLLRRVRVYDEFSGQDGDDLKAGIETSLGLDEVSEFVDAVIENLDDEIKEVVRELVGGPDDVRKIFDGYVLRSKVIGEEVGDPLTMVYESVMDEELSSYELFRRNVLSKAIQLGMVLQGRVGEVENYGEMDDKVLAGMGFDVLAQVEAEVVEFENYYNELIAREFGEEKMVREKMPSKPPSPELRLSLQKPIRDEMPKDVEVDVLLKYFGFVDVGEDENWSDEEIGKAISFQLIRGALVEGLASWLQAIEVSSEFKPNEIEALLLVNNEKGDDGEHQNKRALEFLKALEGLEGRMSEDGIDDILDGFDWLPRKDELEVVFEDETKNHAFEKWKRVREFYKDVVNRAGLLKARGFEIFGIDCTRGERIMLKEGEGLYQISFESTIGDKRRLLGSINAVRMEEARRQNLELKRYQQVVLPLNADILGNKLAIDAIGKEFKTASERGLVIQTQQTFVDYLRKLGGDEQKRDLLTLRSLMSSRDIAYALVSIEERVAYKFGLQGGRDEMKREFKPSGMAPWMGSLVYSQSLYEEVDGWPMLAYGEDQNLIMGFVETDAEFRVLNKPLARQMDKKHNRVGFSGNVADREWFEGQIVSPIERDKWLVAREGLRWRFASVDMEGAGVESFSRLLMEGMLAEKERYNEAERELLNRCAGLRVDDEVGKKVDLVGMQRMLGYGLSESEDLAANVGLSMLARAVEAGVAGDLYPNLESDLAYFTRYVLGE